MGVTLSCLLDGPPQGPLVIAAHGFPDGPGSFDPLVDPLVAEGYRLLRPAMRGYAPSGRPPSGRYDAAALGGDLLALADALSPHAPARLVGHDWGAVAAYAACALAPERFSHVVAMSVPHLRTAAPRWLSPAQLRRSWYMGFFQIPRLPERWLAMDDMAAVERLWRDWSPGYRCPPERMASVKEGLRGRLSDVLGYYRALPRAVLRPAGRLLFRKTRVPALYLHGRQDGCVGVEVAAGIERAHAAGLRGEKVEGAGHFLHLERPERVSELVLGFFGGGGR